MVVLPNHLHAVWTLPQKDADYSLRWSAIKARFTMSLRGTGITAAGRASARRTGGLPPAPEKIPDAYPVVLSGRYAGLKPGLRVGKRETAVCDVAPNFYPV